MTAPNSVKFSHGMGVTASNNEKLGAPARRHLRERHPTNEVSVELKVNVVQEAAGKP